MTTQRPDYKKHPTLTGYNHNYPFAGTKEQINDINERVIKDLLQALTHLDGLMTLSKKFTIELDGSYIEEMQYSCNRLLNAALKERERMLKGVDKHV